MTYHIKKPQTNKRKKPQKTQENKQNQIKKPTQKPPKQNKKINKTHSPWFTLKS